MANHKSAIKRHNQSIRRRDRNQAVRSSVRTLVKKVRAAIESRDREAIEQKIREVNRLLDKAVTKGVLKRNTASRKLARLARAAYASQAPARTSAEADPVA